jgi:hypothetical protein
MTLKMPRVKKANLGARIVPRQCDRNRKRSQRRAIYCPIHQCYLDSVSQKHRLFVDQATQLQQRGVNRRNAMMLIASQTTVALADEWLEAFWCQHCQKTEWLHVHKVGAREYQVSLASANLWQQVMGVIDPHGNPSVSEFTRRQSRMVKHGGVKDFRFVG